MTNQECAEAVLRWANNEHAKAVGRYTMADSEQSGNIAAERTWNDANPMDGVGCMGSNPFTRSIDHRRREVKKKREELKDWEEIKDFVIRKICSLVGNEEVADAV